MVHTMCLLCHILTIMPFYDVTGSNQTGSCEDGSLTLSRGMNRSSVQLVEMCSEGVWSPVCDHNWTVADASVACKELGYQGYHYKLFPAKSSITSLKPPHCAYT